MDAGAETSASFQQAIVLALLSYPECQKRIQNEIDTVVGSGRMPKMTDYKDLPYLRAFIEEVSVWFSSVYHLDIIRQIDPSFQTYPASRFATHGD